MVEGPYTASQVAGVIRCAERCYSAGAIEHGSGEPVGATSLAHEGAIRYHKVDNRRMPTERVVSFMSTSTQLNVEEGFVPVEDGFRVWYRSIGGGAEHESVPLLCLHGGPGVPHDYLENMSLMASEQRRVIFYDQLGCGFSDLPDDTARWQIPRFVTELATYGKNLDLSVCISWVSPGAACLRLSML